MSKELKGVFLIGMRRYKIIKPFTKDKSMNRNNDSIILKLAGVACVIYMSVAFGFSANAAEGGARAVSLGECILTSLERNPDISARRISADNARLNIIIEDSEFDPAFSSSFTLGDANRPTATFLDGVKRSTFTAQSTFGTKTRRGDSYSLTASHSRADTREGGSGINPVNSSNLAFKHTRPLGRGAGRQFNESRLRVSLLNSEISEHQLKSKLLDVVYGVEKAYWELAYAERSLETRKESLALAEKTLKRTRDMAEAGALPASHIVLVEAQTAARELETISAEGALENAALELKTIMNISPGDELWGAKITAADALSAEVSFTPYPFDSAYEKALASRPDALAAARNVDARAIETAAAKNRAKRGFSFEFQASLDGMDDGAGGAASDIVNARHPSAQAGFSMDFPVGMRDAKARLSVSENNESAARLEYEKTAQRAAVEIARAEIALATAGKKIDAARAATRFAEKKLAEEEEKHTLGMAVTQDVLEYQNDLFSARLSELRAMIDFREAAAAYLHTLGSLAESRGVEID
jgi:outer membrane protein TolC